MAAHHPDIASSSTASSPYVHYHIFVNHFQDDTMDFAHALCSRLRDLGFDVWLDELDINYDERFRSRMEVVISQASLQIAIFSPGYAKRKSSMDTLLKMTESEAPILPVFYKVEPFHLRFTSENDKGQFAQWLRHHDKEKRYDLQTIQVWKDALLQASNRSGVELKERDGGQEVFLDKVVHSVFKFYYPRDYHVFLSHRGPDTKEKFAQPLYERLVRSGLRVFLDKEEMVGGLKIAPQIEVAIQFAHVNIVIFSPRFPESSWCMDELSLMAKAEGKILPVFYEVEPSHLDGVYIETLYCHHLERQREDRETIEKWKDALAKVRAKVQKPYECMLAGEELKEELMDKIVERVLKYIPNVPAQSEVMKSSEEHRAARSVLNDDSRPPKVVPVEDFYIGLPEEIQKAVLWQQEEKSVEAKVVGILGGVGIGKTALAKEIFKRQKSNYSKSFCLFDVRNYVARKYALKDLQSKIIEDLKHSPSKEIESVEEGKEILKQHLRLCQALVILDDVDHVDQLDALMPILHPNSLILVTSRNKDVLNKDVLKKFGILNSSIYHLAGLNREDSRKLLLSYAFNLPNLRHPSIDHLLELKIQDFQNLLLSYDSDRLFPQHPSDDQVFESLVQNFVMACDGLPLPLKELGERLSGKNRSGWEKQLTQLRDNCKLFIETKLSICYDSLNAEEQQIFLDVACFFIGEDRDSATRILGMEGLEKLENRCLLKMTSKLEMNEFLRNYGRKKANGLTTPSRFWHQGTKQINDLLDKSSFKPAQFRGITMNGDPGDETEMPCCKQSGETFSGSGNLKFLAAQGGYVEKILTRVRSPDLLWLKWHKCTHSSLPSWITMEKLRVLEVDGSKLTELWQPKSQVPHELRELNICAPLSRFPQSIGQLKLLEKIVVKYSKPLPFKDLREEFCRLHSLKYLEMTNCSGMISLPDSFGVLTNLQYLDLKGASRLKMLPDSFSDLANLQYLDLTGASCLQMLPKSFGNLTVLKYLSLEGCSEIRELHGLEHFTSLETLDARGCKNLESIPELGQLIKLQILDVSRCQKLQSIPGLGQLTKLQTLDVSGCSEIQTLPDLKHLTSLETFNVRGCEKLQNIHVSGCENLQNIGWLGHLRKLQTLDVGGCQIQRLLGLKYLTSLKTLNVSGCKNLQNIGWLGQLRKLQILNLSRCSEIRELPGVKLLTSLETLNISGCENLQSTSWLGQLRKLQTLDVGGCQIQRLLGLKYLTSLKKLNASECNEIQDLPGVERLTSLETLNVSGCQKLENIPELGKLTKLQKLNVSQCNGIRELKGVERLTSLEELNVSGCQKLQNIPELGKLIKLQTLDAGGCREIKSLLGLENLTSLKTLNIRRCDELHSIPGLAQLKNLQILDVGCRKLQRMPGLEHLTSLETLTLSSLTLIESIPGLGQLKKLQTLDISFWRMQTLPSLEHLTSLQNLRVYDCQSLQSIPSLKHLTNVKTLIVGDCGEIKSLQGLEHLISLKKLSVGGCEKLESMPGLERLTKLETLHIMRCQQIQTLSGLEHLISLENLTVGVLLKSIPPLRFLQKLKSLHVWGCPKIQYLPSVEHLISLESLDVMDCEALESIPPWWFLQKLKRLHVEGCPKIQGLPSVEHLISLESLNVMDCKELESMPPLRFLQKFKRLHVWRCPKIQDLPGVEQLISLESLGVMDCKKLESIPSLRFLQKLRSLHVRGCPEIKDLPGVEHLISLQSLEVIGCKGLQIIPPLRLLQKLKSVDVEGCPKIQDLPGVEHLISLESLNVMDCKELESIPLLRFLQKLKRLHVWGCPKIQDLPGVEYVRSLEWLQVDGCPSVRWGRGVLEQLRQRKTNLDGDCI